jgi:hypothetical protein
MVVCAAKGRDELGYARRYLSAPVTALALCLSASHASAETLADTVTHWGLIGAWSLDCALPKDRGKGTLLIYETTADGGVIHIRDFGDATEENKVLSASVAKDGMLNLRLFFPAMKQTHELGFVKLNDGEVRAMYNRDEKNHYSIRNGKFTFDGRPAPIQHKCEPAG